ncbi:inovirus Gp2 family protein [Vibrio parahaemolyticus]|uniref:inovirus Gp2 family protein n=1 Tax=Vibrio parahaemolyticus TaxID=670 RepID=UPI003F65A3B1
MSEHPRTFMFHVVLRYPADQVEEVEGSISRFIRAFKAKIKADLERKLRNKKNVHSTNVRYVWCREYNESMKEHFHVFFLINNDTYHKLGSFHEPKEGHLTWMISTAWASSINLSQINLGGLVEFAGWKKINAKKIPSSHTKERDGVVRDSFESAFHWMSYLCKINTKFYGNNVRNFGCSRD